MVEIIWIVDDNEMLLSMISDYLRIKKIDTEIFSNPHDLIKKFNDNNHVEFIISDYSMDNMDGLELYEYMKDNHNFDRFMIMTADKSVTTDLPVLYKPFDLDELYEFVKELL